MKFRGKMTEGACIKQFINIVNTIARMSKNCVMRITKDRIYFIINEAGVSAGNSPGLWAELDQGHFFNEYHMEGVSEENNEIFLELQPDKFSKVLSSLKVSQAARSLKIKLTRRHTPCLTLEADLPTLSIHARLVVHDVPVQLIPRRQWQLYNEPEMPNFGASIYLPPLRQLKHIVERMKSLSAHICVSANRSGKFIVSVTNDDVDVSTHFKHLSMPVWDSQDNSEAVDLEEFHSATVDIKKFSLFLQGEQINPTKAICNIVSGHVIQMFLLHDDVTLQYFLPAAANV